MERKLGGDEGERVGREIAGDEVIQFHMKFIMFFKKISARVDGGPRSPYAHA